MRVIRADTGVRVRRTARRTGSQRINGDEALEDPEVGALPGRCRVETRRALLIAAAMDDGAVRLYDATERRKLDPASERSTRQVATSAWVRWNPTARCWPRVPATERCKAVRRRLTRSHGGCPRRDRRDRRACRWKPGWAHDSPSPAASTVCSSSTTPARTSTHRATCRRRGNSDTPVRVRRGGARTAAPIAVRSRATNHSGCTTRRTHGVISESLDRTIRTASTTCDGAQTARRSRSTKANRRSPCSMRGPRTRRAVTSRR